MWIVLLYLEVVYIGCFIVWWLVHRTIVNRHKKEIQYLAIHGEGRGRKDDSRQRLAHP